MRMIPKGKEVEITATIGDILNGERHNPFSCPISLAVQRTFPNMAKVDVTGGSIMCMPKKKGWGKAFRLTPATKTADGIESIWMRFYDAGANVEPVTITYRRTK